MACSWVMRGAGALALASVLPGAAGAAGPASYAIEISGFVPVICRATASESVLAAGAENRIDLDLSEFCNDPTGYQVWVDYVPEARPAALQVDGEDVPLSESGSTMIAASSTAAIRTRHLSIELGTGAAPQTWLSVRIVPL